MSRVFFDATTAHATALSNVGILLSAISATLVAPGSAYSVNDVLTIVGGTGTAATIKVNTLGSSGAIATFTLTATGSYSLLPSNPVSVTGGTGTGATFNLTFPLPSTVLIETHNIETAIELAVATGLLEATVSFTPMATNTLYYQVWQNLLTDRAKSAQMAAVIQYFTDLGYTIVQKLNTTTNNTFFWDILW